MIGCESGGTEYGLHPTKFNLRPVARPPALPHGEGGPRAVGGVPVQGEEGVARGVQSPRGPAAQVQQVEVAGEGGG